ncbi:hypothetical protein PAENIP36_22650 [Paenibacillus sp. P36]
MAEAAKMQKRVFKKYIPLTVMTVPGLKRAASILGGLLTECMAMLDNDFSLIK